MAAEYENDADAIRRVCTYHRNDYDHALRDKPNERTSAIPASLRTYSGGPVVVPPRTRRSSRLNGAGFPSLLRHLPLELAFMVLRQLDIRSYLRFRQVSRQAREQATNMLEYRLVAAHGVEGLYGLLRGGLADQFTIVDLYRALITPDCAVCGRACFAGCLYLLTAQRCCFLCLKSSEALHVVTLESVTSRMNGSEFSGINGGVSPTEKLRKKLHVLRGNSKKVIRKRQNRLRRARLKEGPLDGVLADLHFSPYLRELQPFRKSTQLGYTIPVTIDPTFRTRAMVSERQVQQLLSADGQHPWRPSSPPKLWQYVANVVFPWYNAATGEAETGISCKGCQVRFENLPLPPGPFDPNRRERDCVYSKEGYMVHFATCAEAHQMWEESNGGTQTTPGSSFLRRGGYVDIYLI